MAGATTQRACANALEALANSDSWLGREPLEQSLAQLPKPLGFGLGLALAEIDGLGSPNEGGWLTPPSSAWLLPAGADALEALSKILQHNPDPSAFSVKWKVACKGDGEERQLLEQLLQMLPQQARLRLDANGGWDRCRARSWAEALQREPRLEWLEQPLPPADHQGLLRLAEKLPVALDESLNLLSANDRASWPGWLVRRPALEGDPRPLLDQLRSGLSRQMLSSALETGIGSRAIGHLAALQLLGPTPCAPGLAPGWQPQGALGSNDPEAVWAAAGQL
jgi:O-succinylbenzoate synthase